MSNEDFFDAQSVEYAEDMGCYEEAEALAALFPDIYCSNWCQVLREPHEEGDEFEEYARIFIVAGGEEVIVEFISDGHMYFKHYESGLLGNKEAYSYALSLAGRSSGLWGVPASQLKAYVATLARLQKETLNA